MDIIQGPCRFLQGLLRKVASFRQGPLRNSSKIFISLHGIRLGFSFSSKVLRRSLEDMHFGSTGELIQCFLVMMYLRQFLELDDWFGIHIVKRVHSIESGGDLNFGI